MKGRILLFVAASLIALSGQSQVNLDSALVASYYFSNNFSDSSGNGYDATNYGATFTTDRGGHANSAIYFNGSSYVNLPNAVRFQPLSSASLSFWMKSMMTGRFDLFEQRTGNDSPSALNFNLTFNYPSTHYLHFNFPNYNMVPNNYTSLNVQSPSSIDDKWHHFVCIKDVDSDSMSIYQNGVRIGSRSIQDITYTVGGTLRIGREISSTYWYTGFVDDIRIYSRAINPDEVEALYHEQALGIDHNANTVGLNIFPNPSNGLVNIAVGDLAQGRIVIKVINMLGQEYSVMAVNHKGGSFSQLITIPDDGLYFVVVQSDSFRTVRKVVVER